MPVQLVAYAFVIPGGGPPACRVHRVSEEVAGFLLEHIVKLTDRLSGTAPARFRPTQARERFDRLLVGDKAEFIDAAQTLASNLHTAMDQRARPGFLVAVREQNEQNGVRVGVLKLEVHDERAAVASEVGDDLELEAVKGLLDLPGQLQKGAVYPDPRPGSEVVISDRLEQTALYFLRALGVQQIEKPASAVKVLVQAVNRVSPGHVDAIADAIDRTTEPVTPEELFEANADLLPADDVAGVLRDLRERTRPIEQVDPANYALRRIIRAAGIKIEGRVAEMNRAVSIRREGDSWIITVRVRELPETEYR